MSRADLTTEAVRQLRAEYLPKNLKVNYKSSSYEGLHIVRGKGSKLYAADGTEFLDCVNNVANVGHAHTEVVDAVSKQLSQVNTNSRYLCGGLVSYAQRLSGLMPDPLKFVYMVNSGSEANDLALRMSQQACPGATHIAVLGGAYHGHTMATTAMSPYKFEGAGGFACPPHVHVMPCPDSFRQENLDGANAARDAISQAEARGGKISAFVFESMPSCGGQVMLPSGYLRDACAVMRGHGAVCVADEVQTGFGRMGTKFWCFELHDIVPDIVTCGKGIGNGFPMGAVVVTEQVMSAFSNGMEYFNTYAGCNAASVCGLACLDIIEKENLQANAELVGQKILRGFHDLVDNVEVAGNARGHGLCVGLEFVTDKDTKMHAKHVANWVVDTMLTQHQCLLSTDGPYDNVMKIKPPLCFSTTDADTLLDGLRHVLSELLPAVLPELVAKDRQHHLQCIATRQSHVTTNEGEPKSSEMEVDIAVRQALDMAAAATPAVSFTATASCWSTRSPSGSLSPTYPSQKGTPSITKDLLPITAIVFGAAFLALSWRYVWGSESSSMMRAEGQQSKWTWPIADNQS
eukprot:CAMPEP_0117673238 /NCGR_PEP_ID=MMETSP0804-20121206/14360_1 /TAXON_ID=1074897 /ORGANISM="Tetraselmis astigmatica, Strain CCMP880" /LENGTH=573 /DNA_ID=CAMNT_0005481951 /DNA_START=150 /DNA_END=1872 /DNA_ORIENTATION=+